MGSATINLTEPQSNFYKATERVVGCVAGMGCLHPATKIITKRGLIPICDITSPTQVLSWSEKDQKFVFSLSGGSFLKGRGRMLRISNKQGEFVANEHHRTFSSQHVYEQTSSLSVGDKLLSLPSHHLTTEELSRLSSSLDELHCPKIIEDYLKNYADEARLYGQQLLFDQDTSLSSAPSEDDVQVLSQCLYPSSFSQKDGYLRQTQEHIRPYLSSFLLDSSHSSHQKVSPSSSLANQTLKKLPEHTSHYHRSILQSEAMSESHHNIEQYSFDDHSFAACNSPCKINVVENNIIRVSEEEVNVYYDMQVFETNNYVTEDGTIHHNSGKTRTLLTRCVSDLIKYKCNVGYFAPTVPLIRDIAYPVFSDIFEEMGMKYAINKSENIIYTGFGKIFCKSMEIPDRIIGLEIKNGFIDEFDILPTSKAKLAFNKIAARCRLKPDGNFDYEKNANQIFIATTPEGHKATYEMFVKNKLENSRLIRMSTYSNKHNLPAGYIEGLKSQYPTNLIEAYLNGKFKNLNANNVYDFDKELHEVPQTKPSPTETLHIGQDFNVGQMASVVFVARNNRAGGRVWLVIDELTQGRDTPDTIEKIKERYPRNPIIMYPDASGKNRSSKSFSKSDHSLLRQAGFEVRVSSKNPLIKDRVASVNNAFSKNKLYISNECITTIDGLEQQAYDKDGMPEKTGNDHLNDALGYFIFKTMPVATSLMRYEAISHL